MAFVVADVSLRKASSQTIERESYTPSHVRLFVEIDGEVLSPNINPFDFCICENLLMRIKN